MTKAFVKAVSICAALVALLGISCAAFAQHRVVPIWPGSAPGSENWTQKETTFLSPQKETWVRNVTKPTLTVYLPARGKADGTAIVVCPGGAFLFLAWEHEGTQVAEWLSARGVAAFVLKYRLIDTGATDEDYKRISAEVMGSDRQAGAARHYEPPAAMAVDIPLADEDGRQAIRYVREHAAEWGVNPHRIGIMGFSAGGVVATEAAFKYDAASRPDFVGGIYAPVFGEVTAPADAPPLFIACANDDPISNKAAVKLMAAWQAAGRPVEAHVYSKGGHGFGMHKQGLPSDHWIDRFGDWLNAQGLLTPAK
jgi:acetyl esterase/lipase